MKKTLFAHLLPLALGLAACTAEEPGNSGLSAEGGSPSVLSHEERLQFLEEMGFERDRIETVEDGYIAEGDIHFPLEYFPARPEALGKKSQRRSTYLVDPVTAGKIRVRIHSSLSAWTNEALAAVNLLNEVQSAVYFNMVESNAAADITIAADTWTSLPTTHKFLPATTCGIAGFPLSSGIPYQFVSVNMDNSVMASQPLRRTMVIAHELAHTVGLRHTSGDVHGQGELIPGTPTADGNSIMNAGTCAEIPYGLSSGDRQAMRILYPKDVPMAGTRLIDNDSYHDLVVWRPSDGNWYSLRSSTNFTNWSVWNHGSNWMIPLNASQFDAGEGDLVTYDHNTAAWSIRLSGSAYGSETVRWLGGITMKAVPATDLDHDGKTDMVAWDWTSGWWYYLTSSSGYATLKSFQWGQPGDIPVPDTDMDGDGKDDIVVWRPSTGYWYARTAASGFSSTLSRLHGKLGDIPLSSMDVDGDNRQDIAFWRPSNGTWWFLLSTQAYTFATSYQWGQRGDVPIAKTDVDKDWKLDLVVWRRENGTWYTRTKASNFTAGNAYQWGL